MRWMQGWMMAMVMACATQVAAAPYAWIVNQGSDSVSRLDLATNLAVTTSVGTFPAGVAATPDGSQAFVANASDLTVSIIDGVSVSETTTVPVLSTPQGLAVTPDGTKLYVSRYDGFVDVIDTATASVLGSIDLRTSPFSSAIIGGTTINAAGTLVYVGKLEETTESVAVIDTTLDAFVADVFLSHNGNFPLGVTVSPDGTRVYATAQNVNGVRMIDATTNLLITEVPLSCPFGCNYMPALVAGGDGSRVYVGMAGGIAVVDTATAAQVDTIPIFGNLLSGLDVTPDGTRLYCIAQTEGEITIIDTATNAPLGTLLAVGTYPAGFGRFIVPGSTTTTTTVTTTTSSTSTSTTSTLPPVPMLAATARSCQTAVAGSWKKFPVKIHKLFTGCFDRVLRDVASGVGTAGAAASCLQSLDPGTASSALGRARSAARAQLLGRCGALVPAQVGHPCSPTATTMADVADCVLDRQASLTAATVAAEYGASCSIATAAGLDALFPTLCGP